MIMELTIFVSTESHTEEPTHPCGARYEQDRDGMLGGCGIPRTWKSSHLGQGSLQVSRARAYEETGSNSSECCSSREDTRAIREMPPQMAVCEVSKSNNYITLYPGIGNLTKQCMAFYPSVGSFKKQCNTESAGAVRLERRETRSQTQGLANKHMQGRRCSTSSSQ